MVWLALPVAATVLLAATWILKPVFRFLTDEDSVIEWSQFVALLASVVGAAWVALVLDRRRARGLAILFGAMALAAFVVAGEEISWGQRLLGIVTPQALEEINEQGETTLHNVGIVQTGLWMTELAVGLYAVTVPLLVAAGRLRVPWKPAYVLVPPLFLLTWFALPLGYRLLRLTLVPQGRFAVVRMGELSELALYAGGAVFVWLVLLRLRRETVAIETGDPTPEGPVPER